MSFTKFINSPLFIAVFAVASLFVLQSRMKPRLATEIRGAYDEIIHIARDGGTDLEKTKAIQTFANQVASQIRAGFSAGFSTPEGEKKETAAEKFLRLRQKVVVGDVQEVESDRSDGQAFIYKVTNNGDTGIQQLRVNFEYYKGGKLIDVENNWVSSIKVLAPGETVALKQYRSLPRRQGKGADEDRKFDTVKTVVSAFEPM